jgi:hypothetical protein
MSEQPPCNEANADFVQNELAEATYANRYGIYRISHGILSGLTKQQLTCERVAREMGLQGIDDVSKEAVNDYMNQLTSMKSDICNLAKVWYQSLCIRKAISLGITKTETKDGTSLLVSTWSDISQSYIEKPTWKKIEQLYHVLYTSLDYNPNFHDDLEQTWMKNNFINYSGVRPSSQGYKTGIHSVIVMKINMIRKDFNKRISNKHGFKITKSIPKTNGKQAKRRVINIFKKEYVTMDKKKGITLPASITSFDNYLKHIYGNDYKDDFNQEDIITCDPEYAKLPTATDEEHDMTNREKHGTSTNGTSPVLYLSNYVNSTLMTSQQCNPLEQIADETKFSNCTTTELEELKRKNINIKKQQKKLEELTLDLNLQVESYKELMKQKETTDKYNQYLKGKKKDKANEPTTKDKLSGVNNKKVSKKKSINLKLNNILIVK